MCAVKRVLPVMMIEADVRRGYKRDVFAVTADGPVSSRTFKSRGGWVGGSVKGEVN